MESNTENKVEWQPISPGPATYDRLMREAIAGITAYTIDSDRKFIESLPTLAVECLKCARIHRLSDQLKECPNCSNASYGFGGSPSQVSIDCNRCDQIILQSINCECGCVNHLNMRTLRKPKTSGGCFIATATYGSPMAPEVRVFRRFRDDVLLHSKVGRGFVASYYIVSPTFAALISRNLILRTLTRQILLKPLLRLLMKGK